MLVGVKNLICAAILPRTHHRNCNFWDRTRFCIGFLKCGIKETGLSNDIVRDENVLRLKSFNFYKGFIHGKPEERVTRGCSMSFLKMYFISSKANIELFDISSNHKFNLVLHLLKCL